MLYITTNKGKSFKWHIGEIVDLGATSFKDVVEVQADEAELEYIRSLWPALTPTMSPRTLVVRWYGDMAKMIASAL